MALGDVIQGRNTSLVKTSRAAVLYHTPQNSPTGICAGVYVALFKKMHLEGGFS